MTVLVIAVLVISRTTYISQFHGMAWIVCWAVSPLHHGDVGPEPVAPCYELVVSFFCPLCVGPQARCTMETWAPSTLHHVMNWWFIFSVHFRFLPSI